MAEAPFKIGFRKEGDMVNCYLIGLDGGKRDRMALASVRTTILEAHPEVFDAYKAMMTDAFRLMIGTALKDIGSTIDIDDVSMEERPAPNDERSGHA